MTIFQRCFFQMKGYVPFRGEIITACTILALLKLQVFNKGQNFFIRWAMWPDGLLFEKPTWIWIFRFCTWSSVNLTRLGGCFEELAQDLGCSIHHRRNPWDLKKCNGNPMGFDYVYRISNQNKYQNSIWLPINYCVYN